MINTTGVRETSPISKCAAEAKSSATEWRVSTKGLPKISFLPLQSFIGLKPAVANARPRVPSLSGAKALSIIKPILRIRIIRNKLIPLIYPLLQKFNNGSENYYLKVVGVGVKNNQRKVTSYYILGKNEGKGTALTAATVIDLLEEKNRINTVE